MYILLRAFGAIEQVESDFKRQHGILYELSPEQLVSCSFQNCGCDGGWLDQAFEYVKSSRGLVLNTDYTYSSIYGPTGTCDPSKLLNPVAAISEFYFIYNEADMAAYVQATGPITVTVAANDMQTYTGGVMTSCVSNAVNHVVQAVGICVGASCAGGISYWKVRNQW